MSDSACVGAVSTRWVEVESARAVGLKRRHNSVGLKSILFMAIPNEKKIRS